MAISPQLPQYSRQMAKQHRLSFPVLSDKGNEVARQFRLVFEQPPELREVHEQLGAPLPRFNGDDSWTLPMPARYVIRQDGTIAHADVHADYTQRPEPEETLARVRGS